MAKLNITFVNEVGNNLNRYKAIDVNTGDEYLFDLSRNGTITIPGTPLNAEIMNEIVNAINEQFSNLVVEINDTTPSDTKYPSEKAVVDYVGQIANEESVDVSDNVLIKVSGISDNLALPHESQMEVNSIEGNSVVRNQWISNINFPSVESDFTNGVKVSAVDTTNLTITITVDTGGATEDRNFMLLSQYDLKLIASHKYLNIGCPAGGGADKYFFGISPQTQFGPDSGNGGILTNYSVGYALAIVIKNGCPAGTYTFKPRFIDLTQWFGSNDNIPQDILNTPSNFFKYYKGSLAYDTGHIENGSGNLVDTNRNIWDEEWESGSFNWTTGEKVPMQGRCRSKNLIRVLPNTEYYVGTVVISVLSYDDNGNFIQELSKPNRIITTPINCSFIHICWNGTTYNNDICINVSDTNFNGTYVKHIKNTLNLGNDILRSAGKARDKKIPSGEIVRNIGTYTFTGNETFTSYSYGRIYMDATSLGIKYPVNRESKANLLMANFTNIADVKIETQSMSVSAYANQIGFVINKTDSSTMGDINALKSLIVGKTIEYELATPTIEQGTPYDNYIPVYYGGQEYLTGDVPFVINKNYDISIKDQVLTNVKVDKEQSNQIHALENVNKEQSNAIDSLQNEVSNKVDKVAGKGLSSNDYTNEEKERISNLENSQFDSSKLTIEQNLVNTILKYNNVEINRIENLDVAYLPNIVFDVYQDSQFTAQEKVTITNSTDMDMYVSIKGLKEHNNLFVPFGESVTSQLEISDFSGFPDSYIATIEIKIYYNPKTNYNATTGYTVFENVKTINLRATVHPTDR